MNADKTYNQAPPSGAGGLRVSLIQMDIKWADPVANQKAAESALLGAEKSDLYVLPEMWSTGFATDPKDIAEEEDRSGSVPYMAQHKSSLAWMKQMATKLDAAIVGSLAIHATDGTYRNRMYFITPQSRETYLQDSPLGGWGAYYDKRHLFTYGNEHLRYTAGNDRTIVEWRGVRFLLQVCYDLRFPCFSRNIPRPTDNVYPPQSREAYLQDSLCGGWGAVIYVASWPTSRQKVWNILLQARALENQCYILGVNRIGTDPACSYCGGTQVIDAYGNVIVKSPDNEPSVITTELDIPKLTAFRQKFPVLNDAD